MKKLAALFFISALFDFIALAQAQPVISGQPVSRTNNIGDNARFSVTATGIGTLSYQWKFAGSDIVGATASQLNLLITNANQAGLYSVSVTDDAGTTPSSAAVLMIPFGNRVKITQWNFNSAAPDNNTGTGVATPWLGAGTMTLTSVAANNYNDGSTSDPASSDNSGRALQGPSNATVANKSGGPRFSVSTVGYKNIVVSWEWWVAAKASAYWRGQYTINGTDWIDRVLVDKRTPFLALGAAAYTYHFDDLSDVEGVANNPNFAYRVVAEYESTATGSGSDAYVSLDTSSYNNTGPFRVDMVTVMGTTLVEQPIITTQPQNRTNFVGSPGGFSVTATGGDLLYQWFFGEAVINDATNATLVIPNVQHANAGVYSVIVSNAAGFVVSDQVVLTVEDVAPPPGDRYWSGNGFAAGGSGNWDTDTPNRWGLGEEGPFNLTWKNTNVDTAFFVGATSGSVTNSSSVTVNKIVVTNAPGNSYNITGSGRIYFPGNDAEIYVEGANTANVGNTASTTCELVAPVLTKSGGGRLNLNNTNTTVGQWIVNGGAIAGSFNTTNAADALFGAGNPAQLVTNFITLDGGGLGFSGVSHGNFSLGANRGIYVGPGGGQFGSASANAQITIDGPITGPGDFNFPGTAEWPGGGVGANAVFIISNTNNNYQGQTRMAIGEVRLGNTQVFPATTVLNMINTGSTLNGRLNLNGFHQTVAKVVLDSQNNSRIFDTVGGGSLSADEFDFRRSSYTGGATVTGVLAGNGFLRKTSSGNITLGAANTYKGDTLLEAGTLTLTAVGRFGDGTGTLRLQGGGVIFDDNKTGENVLVNPVALENETIFQTGAAAQTNDIICVFGGAWTSAGGPLYLWNTNTFAFELALTNTVHLGAPIEFFGNPGRLTSLNPEGSEQIFNGVISGPGSFKRSVESGNGGRTIFTAGNTYDGGTLVEAGTLLVNNVSGSGTGSGTVTVTAPRGVLGGTGYISGNVIVNEGGSIAPGSSVGVLTLQNGLDMSAGGTMVWELASLKDNSDGTVGSDFDQLVLSGGELQLGGSSKLTLQFAPGTAPNSTIPFWQASRSWTIVGLSGGQNSGNGSFASIVNGSFGAGNFSTTVNGGNILLTFTPGAQAEPSITSHPQSRTNIVGTTASFTVVATGSDPLSYEWFRTDAPFTAISGATNATFLIPDVQAANVGSYFVRVSNGLGTATSQTASLSLAPNPSISPLTGAGTTNVVVSWNTVAGAQYELQANTNLAIPTWFIVTNFVGTGGTFSATNHVPVGDPQRYFRLLAE